MGGEKREKRKEKKKSINIKVQCKVYPSKFDNDNEDSKENFFCNQDIIRDLVDKFAQPEVVDKIADFDYEQHTWDSLEAFLEVIILSLLSPLYIYIPNSIYFL